jgi:hypothetical protein
MFQNFNLLKSKIQGGHLLTTWTWCEEKDVQHGGAHIIEVECAYIPYAQVLEFLNGEQSHEGSPMEWNIYKQIPPQENVKIPRIQNHFDHIWYDVLLFILIIWNFFLISYCTKP